VLNILQKRTSENLINFLNLGSVGIIDVGSVGHLPPHWGRHCYRIRKLLRFEPRENKSMKKNIISLDTVLWSRKCKRNFYIYQGRSGSSLYKQNLNYVRKNYQKLITLGKKSLSESWLDRSKLIKTTTVDCTTLDDVLYSDLVNDDYDLLKIDAQGAEYEIIKGAKKFLKNNCVGVYAELFTVPLYLGIKTYPKVCNLLNSYGFELVKKFPAHGSFASQHDCLFLKKNANGTKVKTIKRVYGV